MSKTKIQITVLLPTTSISRVSDYVSEVFGIVQKHRGDEFFSVISGPIPDAAQPRGSKDEAGRLERRRDEGEADDGTEGQRGKAARDAFDSDSGQSGEPSSGDSSRQRGSDNDGEQPVKRGRGRPRKEAGPTPEGSERNDRPEGRSSRAEGSERNEPRGADEGRSEGRADRQESRGRDERSGDDARSPRQADPVEDDWNEGPSGDLDEEGPEFHAKAPGDTAWPDTLTPDEIDKTVISALLGEHFKATGGKDRALTFDLMEKITDERAIANVPEKSYRKLAKALLKDAARYKFGIKKPSK